MSFGLVSLGRLVVKGSNLNYFLPDVHFYGCEIFHEKLTHCNLALDHLLILCFVRDWGLGINTSKDARQRKAKDKRQLVRWRHITYERLKHSINSADANDPMPGGSVC